MVRGTYYPGVASVCKVRDVIACLAAWFLGRGALDAQAMSTANVLVIGAERLVEVAGKGLKQTLVPDSPSAVAHLQGGEFDAVLLTPETARLLLQLEIEVGVLKQKLQWQLDQLRSTNEHLENLTFTDDVTGLHNQRYLRRCVDDEMARHKRYSHGLALIMLDLDNFKGANDARGHVFGSAVLKNVGDLLLGALRTTDRVARYGGDEFVIVMPNTTTRQAADTAERLRCNLAAQNVGAGGEAFSVTASFGVAGCDVAGAETTAHLMQSADDAMYASKKAGRNCVMVHTASGPTPWQH